MRKIAFIGGMVFNSEKEEFAPATVLCESGYITDIIEDDFFTPCDYEIVDLEGKYLIPGLIDVHTHGIGNYDFNYATESEIPFMCAKYAKAGTTSIMATLASDTISRYMNSIFAINQNRLHARSACANILGIHLEGRYLNPEMKGAHAIELLANPNADELASLALSMMPPPLHVSVAPELSGADEFIKKALSEVKLDRRIRINFFFFKGKIFETNNFRVFVIFKSSRNGTFTLNNDLAKVGREVSVNRYVFENETASGDEDVSV